MESFSASAWEIADGIRAKKLSAREVVEAHFRRIRSIDPKLRAFVCLDEDGAMRQARLADEAVSAGASLGPLHGVPITIKSSIDVAGLRCETGTRIREGHIPTADAPLVTRLKAAGAIVLGNTAVPEFLMAWET